MRFFFTEEDHLTVVRGAEIRAALVHARQQVIHGKLGQAPPAGCDVWLHGLGVAGAPPLAEPLLNQLLSTETPLVLFQLCDAPSMSFERIPEALAGKVRLVLRNHWPSDPSLIPPNFRGRMGWLPPMIKPMAASPGKALALRTMGSIFFGSRTGFSNLPCGGNAREQTVRSMRASGLPFAGGLLPHQESRYHTERSLLVPRMREAKHQRLLQDSVICLAPWGNHALTYRLFEGLAMRCLVLAQPIRASRFLDGGLEPGRHYVETAADLSDLTDLVRYYLEHREAAQRIADAGHLHFKQHFAGRGRLISEWLFEATVDSWAGSYRPSSETGWATALRARAARWFPNEF